MALGKSGVGHIISGVMWKTVSEACNLASDYYYKETKNDESKRGWLPIAGAK